MTHYVCPACSGVAELPGVCQTPDCPQNGDLLAECTCDDDRHEAVKREEKEADSE
jgi:hypothetical protein